MTIKINYLKKSSSKLSANVVFFTNDKFSINHLKKYVSNFEFNYINDLLKSSDLKKNIFVYELN